MALVTRQELEAVCAEAHAATDAQVDVALRHAEARLDVEWWGSRLAEGVTYLAAHLLLSYNPGLGASMAQGPVQSVSVGGVSQSFAVASAASAGGAHGTTRYGVLFDELVASLGPALFAG
ncbi:DUF4054 domain-containing protein [Corallococcus sp. EGB]|uniref:DUF4054 domain-containing protein n=1 Tax=Corallococcus sp. EGB TaxID=1521117 RepID=UPI001CC0ABDD|nr:DUF4054 domain-containing protein [Corallococcus sp. EGB]